MINRLLLEIPFSVEKKHQNENDLNFILECFNKLNFEPKKREFLQISNFKSENSIEIFNTYFKTNTMKNNYKKDQTIQALLSLHDTKEISNSKKEIQKLIKKS